MERFIDALEACCPHLGVVVPDWGSGGGVYAHYLHVLRQVQEIKQSQQPTHEKVTYTNLTC